LTETETLREEARQARISRAKSIYAATWFNHGEATKDSAIIATEELLSKLEFAKVLLSGAYLKAATLVPDEKDNSKQAEADNGTTKLINFTNPLSKRFVKQEEWARKLARELAMVLKDLRKAFTTLRVKHRSLLNILN
jgi:hypothetical protein